MIQKTTGTREENEMLAGGELVEKVVNGGARNKIIIREAEARLEGWSQKKKSVVQDNHLRRGKKGLTNENLPERIGGGNTRLRKKLLRHR